MVEKLKIFEKEAPASGLEIQTLHEIAGDMLKGNTVNCTSCRYCLSHCPKEIDIPALISAYNEDVFSKGGFLGAYAVQSAPEGKRPSDCIGCKACEKVCPQQIKIAEIMKDFDSRTDRIRKNFFGTE